ncbi:hypothetical protein bcere0024_0740 [Bacillus cereus Rock4-18]|nr:hypothetical protein bcere0024_0740 [Bacillus cereus Rock4-18]
MLYSICRILRKYDILLFVKEHKFFASELTSISFLNRIFL